MDEDRTSIDSHDGIDIHPGGNLGESVVDWAEEDPGAVALVDRAVTLTRGDLVEWARTAAGHIAAEIDPCPAETAPVVALLLPRSWGVPAAIVAARLARTVFLPLDVRQPVARLGSILQAARPSIVLAFDNALARAALDEAGLPHGWGGGIEPPFTSLERMAVRRVDGGRHLPIDIGHLVFTSGSTGAPKGVLLRDAPLLATVAAQRTLLGTDGSREDSRSPSAWTLNPAFDASLSDIFCSILGTAPLAVFREEQSHWRSLAALMRETGAVRADLAPSLMRIVPPVRLPMTSMIFGGERCDPETAELWGTACRAFQAYGPTEAAVCAMMARAGAGWAEGLLGRPLPHQTVLLRTAQGIYRVRETYSDPSVVETPALFNAVVLTPYDAQARLAGVDFPPEAEGEILLAGPAVAAGYLDAPEATARRFDLVEDAWTHFTGDIARYAGGRLTWIGRNDRQVKVNGRLVCPEEIEAAAGTAWNGPCACIPEERGLALALGDPDDAEGETPETLETSAVLAAVAACLGAGMRPRRAVRIGAWPLNANGKTDLAEVARRLAERESGA